MAKSDLFVGAGKFTAGTLSGLFRQAAGEDRWQPITKGLPEPASIQALTVHPSRRDVIFAGTQDGVYRSVDGGASWQRTDFPRDLQVWSVTVHPRDERVVYAGTSPIGVLRSEDGGDTWTRLSNAVQPERITMGFACRVMRIAVVPGPPDELYAGLEVAGAMRSLDGGEHWSDCSADLDHAPRVEAAATAQHLGEPLGSYVVVDRPGRHHRAIRRTPSRTRPGPRPAAATRATSCRRRAC